MIRPSQIAVVLLLAVLAAGCSSAADATSAPVALPTTAPQATLPAPTAALLAPTQGAATASEAAQITLEPPAAPTDAPAVLLPGQRSAPLGVDEGFHNDEATLVAATGRPQLIEFFTFW